MDVMTGRCRSTMLGGARCELQAEHDGKHVESGFALWDEALSVYPVDPEPAGGLLDLLSEVAS